MAALVEKKMAKAAITTALATVYTTPASTRALMKTIDVANTTAVAVAVTVHLVDSGGAAATSNQIIPGVSVPANSIMQWTGLQVLATGDFIRVVASATGCNIFISGAEST